jgi:hypothetical protein
MNEQGFSPGLIVDRVAAIRRELGTAITGSGNARLLQIWPHWDSKLLAILEGARGRPEVQIALLGGAGSGKSTLINALLGMRLLPMADGKPCTSAVTEVGYGEGSKYEAVVTFITREEWRREFDLMLNELAEVPTDGDDSTVPPASLGDIRKSARDKIMAVYGLDDPALVTVDRLRSLVEPPEINRCFEMRVGRVESDDTRKFAKLLRRYLHSDERFWPIVKHVRIRGPFVALEGGASLIDLPGLNDPNRARESLTRSYLKSARFVWVVFNVKRAMGKDLVDVMRSEDFHRNLVLDGREGALTFVGTATDAIDPALAIEKFNLDEDTPTAEIILANNREMRKIVRNQLTELAFDYRAMAGGDSHQVRTVLERLQQSPIFTVSSREFLRLAGLAPKQQHPAGLVTLEQTEIPDLRRHLDTLSAEHGVKWQARELLSRIEAVRREVEQELQAQLLHLSKHAEISEQRRAEMEGAVSAAHEFLLLHIKHAVEKARTELDAALEVLGAQLLRAVERGQASLESVLEQLERMQWNSLRLMMARGGRYGRQDLSVDIGRPVLESIAFAYSAFFGERLIGVLDRTTDALLRLADDYRRDLLDSIARLGLPGQQWNLDLKKLLKVTEQVVGEQTAQVRTEITRKISDDRKRLHEGIIDQVRAHMAKPYSEAAKIQGRGTKRKIIALITEHATAVASVMFRDVEEQLLGRVRGLCDWLARQFATAGGTVERHAAMAGENFRGSAAQAVPTPIAQDRVSLEGLRDLVAGLADENPVAA